jgi:hypothetical protein
MSYWLLDVQTLLYPTMWKAYIDHSVQEDRYLMNHKMLKTPSYLLCGLWKMVKNILANIAEYSVGFMCSVWSYIVKQNADPCLVMFVGFLHYFYVSM